MNNIHGVITNAHLWLLELTYILSLNLVRRDAESINNNKVKKETKRKRQKEVEGNRKGQ